MAYPKLKKNHKLQSLVHLVTKGGNSNGMYNSNSHRNFFDRIGQGHRELTRTDTGCYLEMKWSFITKPTNICVTPF